jgi:hypothetical protein
MADDADDIMGHIAYVVENYDDLDKETVVIVLKAALAEIINLRIAVATAKPSEA